MMRYSIFPNSIVFISIIILIGGCSKKSDPAPDVQDTSSYFTLGGDTYNGYTINSVTSTIWGATCMHMVDVNNKKYIGAGVYFKSKPQASGEYKVVFPSSFKEGEAGISINNSLSDTSHVYTSGFAGSGKVYVAIQNGTMTITFDNITISDTKKLSNTKLTSGKIILKM